MRITSAEQAKIILKIIEKAKSRKDKLKHLEWALSSYANLILLEVRVLAYDIAEEQYQKSARNKRGLRLKDLKEAIYKIMQEVS